jgi:putative flippase GtrA
VGLLNTALGLLVVVLCAEGLGWSPYFANAAGYAAGLAFGFAVNRVWTFGDQRRATVTAPRYLLAFGVSYSANLVVLAVMLRSGLDPTVSQGLALTTYSAVFFLTCRFFVFVPFEEK